MHSLGEPVSQMPQSNTTKRRTNQLSLTRTVVSTKFRGAEQCVLRADTCGPNGQRLCHFCRWHHLKCIKYKNALSGHVKYSAYLAFSEWFPFSSTKEGQWIDSYQPLVGRNLQTRSTLYWEFLHMFGMFGSSTSQVVKKKNVLSRNPSGADTLVLVI